MTGAPSVQGTTRGGLYYRIDGPENAPTLILLHGGPGAHHDYLYPQMLFLANTHRVLTYDQRGGGQSKTDDRSPVTWHTHVDDLTDIVREFQLEHPTIVGYSWGAMLAMLYSIEKQNDDELRPSRLVLISPAAITSGWRQEFETTFAERLRSEAVQQMRADLASSGLRESDPAAYRQRSFELSVAGYFADPHRSRDLTPFRVTGRVQQSVWESLGNFDLRQSLEELGRRGIPSLVLHGRHDPIPLASAEAVAQRLGTTVVVLEDSGHVPYVEQLAELSTVVGRFLDYGT